MSIIFDFADIASRMRDPNQISSPPEISGCAINQAAREFVAAEAEILYQRALRSGYAAVRPSDAAIYDADLWQPHLPSIHAWKRF